MVIILAAPKEGPLQRFDGFQDPFWGFQNREEVERHILQIRLEEDRVTGEVEGSEGTRRKIVLKFVKDLLIGEVLDGYIEERGTHIFSRKG